jgi:hypothetical protein
MIAFLSILAASGQYNNDESDDLRSGVPVETVCRW